MNISKQSKFETYYQQHCKHLALKGLQPKTIEAYSRAIRRIGAYINGRLDNLSQNQLIDYFSDLKANRSWSTVKLDLYGLRFFYAHVLDKSWTHLPLIKAPRVKRIPDIITIDEVHRLCAATRQLSYRVLFYTLYSMGLRLGEGLRLQTGDIDAVRQRVHIRNSKGNKDRYVPLPANTLDVLRRFWQIHKHPTFIFPNRKRGLKNVRLVDTHLDRGGVQTAMKKVVKESGINKKISCHSLRYSYATHLLEAGVDLLQCENNACAHQSLIPHSCGHGHCPHCQNHETNTWINRQLQKQLPAEYFMLTFTLPEQLRRLAWHKQRLVYTLLFECVWQTIRAFCLNDKKLGGVPGALAVLHTHSRRLDFHPHIHLVMPAAVIDKKRCLWKNKQGTYLFNQNALAKVFRAKMLQAFTENGLKMPDVYPHKWVVDCKHVGKGDKALLYLGRYLYRGVINEKNIISCENGKVTFRYKNSKTKKYQSRNLKAVDFLWLVFQHILPRGFRRAREYGFWHANSKKLIRILQWVFRVPVKVIAVKRKRMRCPCCGSAMNIVETLLPANFSLKTINSA